MKLSELEQMSEKLNSNQSIIKVRKEELTRLESQRSNEQQDFELRKRWASLRGEKISGDFSFGELDKVRQDIASIQSVITKQEKEILIGMKEFTLDALPAEIPSPNADNKIILNLEGGSFPNFLSFLAEILNKETPLKLDNILLDSNKITIMNVHSTDEVVSAIENLVQNIRRLASMALKEPDLAVKETA